MSEPSTYSVEIKSENPIPHDVLIEHIAVSLQAFQFAGKVNVEMAHPFDNPSNVVFDDVQAEEYTGPEPKYADGGTISNRYDYRPGTHAEGSFLPVDPYPNVTRALDSLRADRG